MLLFLLAISRDNAMLALYLATSLMNVHVLCQLQFVWLSIFNVAAWLINQFSGQRQLSSRNDTKDKLGQHI